MASTPTLLGIDLGTTAAKAVLLRPDGKPLAAARTRYEMNLPRPGWVEQDPEDWWRAVGRLARALRRQAPRAFARVAALGGSGQGCPLVAIDRQGKPVRPALLWLDTRAADQAAWMAREAGELLRSANGNRVGVYNLEPKALWFREHEPRRFERTAKFLTAAGYLNFRLTGEAVVNYSDGGILFAYDRARCAWSAAVLAKLGLPAEKYPRLAPCHAIIGKVTADAARATGLRPGIPVVAGGEDTSAAALAAGAVEAGHAYLSMGTAAVLGVVLRQLVDEPRLLSFPHVLPERSLLSGSMSSAGAALAWYLRKWNPTCPRTRDPQQALRALDREAARSRPGAGALVFLPYLSGELHPILDAQARGVLFGLSLEQGRGDVARSLMEGTAFAIRHNLHVAEAAGARVEELFATGGPTRSPLWCQIISDVTGCSLIISSAGAPEGDALLAGCGAGIVEDPAKVVTRYLAGARRYAPRPNTQETYRQLFGVYREIYTRLKDQFQVLRSVRESSACNS